MNFTHNIYRGIATICILTMATLSLNAMPIDNTDLKIHCDLPSSWNVKSISTFDIIVVPTPQIATISISHYVFDTPPTPGIIQNRRIPLFFDGWINLFYREGRPQETRQSKAESRSLAVYGRTYLDADNTLIKRVVIEHYFVKDTDGYSISVDTMESNWPRIEHDLRSILDSFHIM